LRCPEPAFVEAIIAIAQAPFSALANAALGSPNLYSDFAIPTSAERGETDAFAGQKQGKGTSGRLNAKG
jgi:hypothetical protein